MSLLLALWVNMWFADCDIGSVDHRALANVLKVNFLWLPGCGGSQLDGDFTLLVFKGQQLGNEWEQGSLHSWTEEKEVNNWRSPWQLALWSHGAQACKAQQEYSDSGPRESAGSVQAVLIWLHAPISFPFKINLGFRGLLLAFACEEGHGNRGFCVNFWSLTVLKTLSNFSKAVVVGWKKLCYLLFWSSPLSSSKKRYQLWEYLKFTSSLEITLLNWTDSNKY